MHWDHATEIKRRYGYRDFGDQPEHVRSDVILEAQRWTGFADAFTHISEGNARIVQLAGLRCLLHAAQARQGQRDARRPVVPMGRRDRGGPHAYARTAPADAARADNS